MTTTHPSPSPDRGRPTPEQGVVSVRGLTKHFGPIVAVHNLSFDVLPGRVTGFLGPNGAGKTTSLRMLLGLANPTSGTATISGKRYTDLTHPLREVGAALEATSFHPGRTALDHLRTYAPYAGATDARCSELLSQVGLDSAAKRRVGGFSLGMRQRLALATTLLGDPKVLLLDEPSNGLDPEGIRWLRGFLRFLASQGKTVLVSSHMLSEVQQSVDDVIIIAKGELVHASSMPELSAMASPRVQVASPNGAGLDSLLATHQWSASSRSTDGHSVEIDRVSTAQVGAAAFAAGLELHTLRDSSESLEDIFLRLVNPSAAAPSAPAPSAATPSATTQGAAA
jgi:ABC-2 type transport system ATP-binding protein